MSKTRGNRRYGLCDLPEIPDLANGVNWDKRANEMGF